MWNDYRKEIDSIHLDEKIKESLKYRAENKYKKFCCKKMAVSLICASIIILSIVTLQFVQTSSNDLGIEYNTSTYISKKMRKATKYNIEHFVTGTCVSFDYVVLATVISNDKADFKLPSGYRNPIGYTFSRVLVQKTYKGEILDNQILQTIKEGGIFSVEEIYGSVDDQTEIGEGYVNTTLENDVMLEEGKTYLLCLKYNSKEKKYEIIGRNVGIREANIPKTKRVKKEEYKDVKVKDYKTNTYEPIDEVLKNLQF